MLEWAWISGVIWNVYCVIDVGLRWEQLNVFCTLLFAHEKHAGWCCCGSMIENVGHLGENDD